MRPERRPETLRGSFLHKYVKAALLSVALLAAVTGVPTIGATSVDAADTLERPDSRPNIVLITTDDQTLTDMRWMPTTRRLLGDHGVTFTNALSPHPQCCPARAEIVTGQYGQNNGVRHNRGDLGGFTALVDKGNTLATWLQDSGYQTAQIGKYMNEYGAEDGWQEGWTHWNASVAGEYSYDRTVLFNDGNPQRRKGYITDVIRKQSRAWVEEFSAGRQPFFIWASHLAPHKASGSSKAIPAQRHAKVLAKVRAPQLSAPSFNASTTGASAEQPAFEDPQQGRQSTRGVQAKFTARIRSLQAVDDMVRALLRELRATGELDNTYVFFTSDNGYLLGEHQLLGKNALYQETMAVPMLVRAPGATGSSRSGVPVTITDLAPTIADIARVTPDRLVDGQSFLPLLRGRSMPWRDTQLVQTGTIETKSPQPGWEWRGVRTDRYTYGYSPQTGQQLLFDRAKDGAEVTNFAADERYVDIAAELRRRTELLEDCRGDECSPTFGPVGDPLPGG